MFAVVAPRPRGPDTTILIVPERRAADLIAGELRHKGHDVYVTVTTESRRLGSPAVDKQLINAI